MAHLGPTLITAERSDGRLVLRRYPRGYMLLTEALREKFSHIDVPVKPYSRNELDELERGGALCEYKTPEDAMHLSATLSKMFS